MIVQTTDKFEALHAFINSVMKTDNTIFRDVMLAIQQNKELKASLWNDRAMSQKDEIKHCLSIPESLYSKIKTDFPVSVFDTKSDVNKFMKKFPQFCVPVEPEKTKFI